MFLRNLIKTWNLVTSYPWTEGVVRLKSSVLHWRYLLVRPSSHGVNTVHLGPMEGTLYKVLIVLYDVCNNILYVVPALLF